MIFRYIEKTIFVIHSEKDDQLLQDIINHYQDQYFNNEEQKLVIKFKIEFLSSKSGIYHGEDFGKRIMELIERCDYCLSLLTKKSVKSHWVNQEIGFMFGIKKRDCLYLVESSLVGRSTGFIHSNIDVQKIEYITGNINLDKIDGKLQITEGLTLSKPVLMDVPQYVV